jgi:hypothetical protein
MPHFICFIPCICFQLPLYVLEEICKSSINATSISIMLNIKVHLWICYGILHAISLSIEPLYSHSLFPLIAIVFLVQWGSSEFCATCTSGIVLLWFRILTWDFLIKSSSASIQDHRLPCIYPSIKWAIMMGLCTLQLQETCEFVWMKICYCRHAHTHTHGCS